MTFRTSPNTDRGRRWCAVDEITGKPTPFVVDGRRTSAARHDTTMAHRALRPQYSPDYYVRLHPPPGRQQHPAVHHRSSTAGRHVIDHLWIRGADLDASKRYHGAITAALGLEAGDRGERFHLTAEGGGFTVLGGSPTQNLHLAIGVGDQERSVSSTGLRWRPAAATTARLANDRTITGYYGAYLLDPDANTIEAVFHDRTLTSTIATNQTATTIELVNHNG